MYGLRVEARVIKDLRRLHPEDERRLRERIDLIQRTPYQGKRLIGSPTQSVRVGDYRILYKIVHELKEIHILAIGHRKNAYDNL